MTIQEQVLAFIKPFQNEDCRRVFTEGYCYWFAKMLYDRFAFSNVWVDIVYAPIQDHFLCKIDGVFYDVTGVVVPDEKVYSWRKYKQFEPIQSLRIMRDVILKV